MIMKVSIVTVCFNSVKYIDEAIQSVVTQNYPDIEYIIIDGGSTDGTVEIVKSYGDKISKFISEPDFGIYDAMNKGIMNASGAIVGLLNSDDFFYDDKVVEKIANSFISHEIDGVYGDVQFVDSVNTKRIVRYYSSRKFRIEKFKNGYMPAHPSFYIKRELFEKLGYYKIDYQIASDFELLVRFMHNKELRFKYLEMPFVSMRPGGISNRSLSSRITLNKEILRACKENGIKTNTLRVYSKYFLKIFEYIVPQIIRLFGGYTRKASNA